MALCDDYLNLYKTWEGLLRDSGTDVRTLEASLEQTDPAKMARIRMLRLFRNYLTHENDPGYLMPTDKMVAFLNSEVMTLKLQDDVVKKHLRNTKTLFFEANIKCSVALEALLSAKRIQFVRHDGDGEYVVLSTFDVMAAALGSKTVKLSAIKPLKQKVLFAAPVDRMSNLDSSRLYVCTDTGKPDGVFAGVVSF